MCVKLSGRRRSSRLARSVRVGRETVDLVEVESMRPDLEKRRDKFNSYK